MASSQEPTQDLPSSVVQHNHIVIQYQQPPDPAIVNHILEVLIGVTRTFTHRNPAQVPYIWDYITQIVPVLQTLYSQSAQQVLAQEEYLPQYPMLLIYHLLMEIYRNFSVN